METHSPLPGRPIWVELYTSDPEAARLFYGSVFDWTVRDLGSAYAGYLLFERDGQPVAGCMRNDEAGAPDSWTVYLESDNVSNTAGMAEANGGTVLIEPMQVGDLGHLAVVRDPAGATIGIWQPVEHDGFPVGRGHGLPVWFEVVTTGYEEAIAFYENVFGWVTDTMVDSPELRYTTLGRDDDALAGIMAAPAGGPAPTWDFYVDVTDTDATLARAVAAGATVTTPAEDSPYGRLAALTDPTGARFLLMGPTT